MRNANADSANDTGLPSPMESIRGMQTMALQLENLLRAANALDNEGAYDDERMTIMGLAERIAGELTLGLDAVNLTEAQT